MRLVSTDIEATYLVTRGFSAPFHRGGQLHGLFGHALRKVACAELLEDVSRRAGSGGAPGGAESRCAGSGESTVGAPCAGDCARPGGCDWKRLFDPVALVPPPHRILSGVGEPPSPVLLLSPPPGARPLAPGDTWSVRLRLFGENSNDAARVERALAAVADLPIGTDEGRVALESTRRFVARDLVLGDAATAGERAPETAMVATAAATEATRATNAAEGVRKARVTVRFETPVRFKRGGQLAAPEDIDFAMLFDQVWRRLTTMCILYGQYGPEDDATFRRLREGTTTVRTVDRQLRGMRWDHLSAETGVQKPLRGVIGYLVFEGEGLGALSAVLRAGEVVHVGGSTGLGLGRMRVELDCGAE